MYINIASYLYGKQINLKMGNTLYLQIFICARLNWLDNHECHTMSLKSEIKWCIHLSRSLFLYFEYYFELPLDT